jgi:Protein of unknown function (DUF1573)
MKSWIILAALAVGLTAAVTVAIPLFTPDSSSSEPGFPAPVAGKGDGPVPVVEVDGDLTHKFGVMAQDTDAKHSWVFKNSGAGPLELRNIRTDCSCTVIQLGKAETPSEKRPLSLSVPPGGTETIDVEWKTNKVDGPYRKTATIGTNDPSHPEINLLVEGTVRPAIILVPGEGAVNFQTVSNDESYKRLVGIYSGDLPDTKLTGVVSSNPAMIGVESRPMTADEAKQSKAEKGFILEVTLKMVPHLGSFAEEILIQTDHPLKKEVRIPVLGRLTGPITLTPDRVVLRDVTSSNGGGLDLTMWVRGRTSAQFAVEKKPESLDVAFEPIPQPAASKGSKYKMTIKVIPGTPSGKILGEIVLKTDHPQATEVKVPVDILVQGAN